MKIILKASEGHTPLWKEDEGNTKLCEINTDWRTTESPKDFFTNLTNIKDSSVFNRVRFRSGDSFVYYKGIVLDVVNCKILFVITQEGEIYYNFEDIIPSWLAFIKKGMKDIGLSNRKNIHPLSSATIQDLFTIPLTVSFEDSDSEVQKQILTEFQTKLVNNEL